MNKRIRKKQLKRTLNGLLAAYEGMLAAHDVREAAQERIFHKTIQNMEDAREKSHEEYVAAVRCFMEAISTMAFSGPPPKFLTELNTSAAV